MRTAPTAIVCLVLILVAGLCQVACGAGNPGQQSGTPATPKWSSISEQTACEAYNPSYCTGTYGFALDSAGNYVVGPAPNGVTIKGTITTDDLNSLMTAANGFMGSIVSTGPCSMAGNVIPGSGNFINIVSMSGQLLVVFDANPPLATDVCPSADPTLQNQLTTTVEQLLAKYYPQPFPAN